MILDDGEIESRAVIVATGVSYRKLDSPGVADLTGRGVYYGATASEATQVAGDVVHVVGAANSAGQAALQLARYAERVVMVVRGPSLAASMSSYLVERIGATSNIEIRFNSEVCAATGEGHLERLTLRDRRDGATEDVTTAGCSCSSAPSPAPTGSGSTVARDEHGFVITGTALGDGWVLPRPAAVPARDQRPGRLRRRRRAARLDEARRVRGRRGCDGRLLRPQLPGDHLMTLFEEVRALELFDGLGDQQLLHHDRRVRGGDLRRW